MDARQNARQNDATTWGSEPPLADVPEYVNASNSDPFKELVGFGYFADYGPTGTIPEFEEKS